MIYTEQKNKERAIVVGLIRAGQSRKQVEEYLDELELLADTAGAEILERVVQDRDRIDPAFMIGRGKARELAETAKYLDADLIIFDDDLSPAQVKNIEELCKIKIVDRSGLILDIFASHARTREARTQVELAQLKYFLPRLTRQWTHLSRQVGGIGVRGPGETQLEVDRRMIRKRIALLESELEKIARQRTLRRKNRRNVFKAALVGYTNVGKSTILNSLTNAEALVKDQLFATLDSTIRSMDLSNRNKVLLIDTVGFIRKLPHHLVASFKSTLEEVSDADLLLHVIDISLPEFREQMSVVDSVLSELKINNRPVLKVFNKIDLLEDPSIMPYIRQTEQPCVFISAQRGIYLDELEKHILTLAEQHSKQIRIILPLDQTKILSQLHNMAEISTIEYQDDKTIVHLTASPVNASKINRLVNNIKFKDEYTGS
ncbi:GTPase HflX [candidate division KSB1 bacterium]|nr:GTPase HflX [candidate division KSB1 bacterium]